MSHAPAATPPAEAVYANVAWAFAMSSAAPPPAAAVAAMTFSSHSPFLCHPEAFVEVLHGLAAG